MLVCSMAYSLTLKMEAICSLATSVGFQWIAWHYITEDRTLLSHLCESLKFYKIISIFQINKDGSFLIKDIQHSDEGNYSCSVENVHGSDEIVYSIRVRGMLPYVTFEAHMVVNIKTVVFLDVADMSNT
jgi:hypothetical protein